jgi:hypothetical protein
MNLARERGDEFQLILTRYGLERLLYRLAIRRMPNSLSSKAQRCFNCGPGSPIAPPAI